jgi:putative MATE family efflux protein
MTEGRLFKKIIGFAIPVWLGLLFQQFYNLADAVLVGRMLGVDALAGVGSTTGLTFLAISIATSIGNGFAVSVSQRFGAGDERGIKRYFGNAVTLSLFIAVVLTIATVMIADPVLVATKTPEEIYGYAHDYVVIIFAGLICTVCYNLFAAALRAIGDSRTPVLALIVASIINIALDILMIGALRMGVSGAAMSTVISQLMSALFLLMCIRKRDGILKISFEHLRLTKDISNEQLRTALPMTVQGTVIAFGILIVQTSINAMGTVYVAGCTAGNKLYGIMAAPIEAVCQSMIPVAGQNFGAKKYDRIDKGLRTVLIIGWILTCVLGIIAWLLGPAMMRLFVDNAAEEVIAYGHQFMLSYVLGYGFLTIQMGICFALQGSGFAKMTIISGMLETAGRLFGSIVLVNAIGFSGICLALPLAWVFTSVYLILAYMGCRKKIRTENVVKEGNTRKYQVLEARV